MSDQIGKAINIRDIPPDLKLQFRKMCLDRNITMNDALISMIEREVAYHRLHVGEIQKGSALDKIVNT